VVPPFVIAAGAMLLLFVAVTAIARRGNRASLIFANKGASEL
jgi:hypothetical protein